LLLIKINLYNEIHALPFFMGIFNGSLERESIGINRGVIFWPQEKGKRDRRSTQNLAPVKASDILSESVHVWNPEQGGKSRES
jgi:hypothetical protein